MTCSRKPVTSRVNFNRYASDAGLGNPWDLLGCRLQIPSASFEDARKSLLVGRVRGLHNPGNLVRGPRKRSGQVGNPGPTGLVQARRIGGGLAGSRFVCRPQTGPQRLFRERARLLSGCSGRLPPPRPGSWSAWSYSSVICFASIFISSS